MQAGTAVEVLRAFLRLGLTSFGGPIAHLGYFRTEFVERRRWLTDHAYSDLVALCQFLPGPASSQVGMALGLGRAGWLGALAAWSGFTLPSAVVLVLFAYGVARFTDWAESGAIHGLKIAAVAVVAQAVLGMARSLCPDRARAMLAIGAALFVLAVPSPLAQVVAMALCGLVARWMLKLPHSRFEEHAHITVSKRAAIVAFICFIALLIGLPVLATAIDSPLVNALDGIYRAGALVFGGGHVVLPLLQSALVPAGIVTNATFLAGYGAAQAIPGPLFTFAAYLGAAMTGSLNGWTGGLLFLIAIFVPGFLILVAALPFWDVLRRRANIQNTMAGINAAVVGILLAALYNPLWVSTIHSKADFGLALAAFGVLLCMRMSPVFVVLLCALGGWIFSL